MPVWPNLRSGMMGPEVGNWQRFLVEQRRAGGDRQRAGDRRPFLVEQDAADWKHLALVPDERFGARTEFATKVWQRVHGLTPDGVVGPITRRAATPMGFVPFVQARHCRVLYPAARQEIDLIVIHTMENQEKPSAAEDVAWWFASDASPIASCHYCIDQDSVVQCVRNGDVAYHAPGANHDGVGLEHAGRASQTRTQWDDEASRAILLRSAALAARLCRRYAIPIVRLDVVGLLLGERGFCGHVDATHAFPGPGRTHWDPGAAFPWTDYLALVRERASE